MQKVAVRYFAQVTMLFATLLVTDLLLGYPVEWYYIVLGIAASAKAIRAVSILWHVVGIGAGTAALEEVSAPGPHATAHDLYEQLDDAGKAQVDQMLAMIRDSVERSRDD